MTLTMTRILGWLVIAHGLSHAVLPMRGSLASLEGGDWIPVALYAGSMVGFFAAGVGILGLRPFDRAISPLLVLASAHSLVAIFVLGDPGLWFGAACDITLILVGLWRAFAGWPMHPSHRRIWHVAAVTLALVAVSYVGLSAFTFPYHRTWGSEPDELSMALPGDPERRDPALEIQHAVTINAPAGDLWAVLMQVGEQQGIEQVEPSRAMVLKNRATLAVRPIADEQTRFIIRSRLSDRSRQVWMAPANLLGLQPRFITERRMMRSIKQRAEADYARRLAEKPVRTIEILATDDMKYNVNLITAEPGEEIRIRLTSQGVIPKVAMAHNVVVVHLDTDIDTMLKDGAPFRDTDFIPPSMMNKVIAKTALAGPGETVQVTFKVPTVPGDYPYLCTFAGHYQAGMKGTLSVAMTDHDENEAMAK